MDSLWEKNIRTVPIVDSSMTLLITNPLEQGEEVFVKGDKGIIEKAFEVVVQNGKCHIPQTLSRKKGFIPKIGYFCTNS